MKKTLFFTGLCILFLCMPAQARSDEPRAATDFSLQDLNNNTFTLRDYTNKQPVLLLFWATWCPFCREELKVDAGRYDRLVKDGVKFVAVDVGESPARVTSFITKYNYAFPVLLDKDNKAALAYNLLGIPTYVLIDKKGMIRQEAHSFPEEEYKKIIAE